jgi:hypothetical protein
LTHSLDALEAELGFGLYTKVVVLNMYYNFHYMIKVWIHLFCKIKSSKLGYPKLNLS